MQSNIAVSYSARDMLWANENFKLGNLAWTPTSCGVFAKVIFQYLPLHVTTVRVNENSKLHIAC